MTEIVLPKLLVSREDARQQIEAQIEKGQQLWGRDLDTYDELNQAMMETDNWSKYNRELLVTLFNNWTLVDYISFNSWVFDDDSTWADDVDDYDIKIENSINSLKGICDRLKLYDEPPDTSQSTFGNDVFIVHGHDEAAKHAIAGFVRKFGLNAIILDEQANRGQTIIEKFEEHAGEAGFAIILLTPDDVGAPKDETNDLKPQARQNVVLELGYFWGRLGRERMCVLHKEGVELPSDIHGILYVPLNNPHEWQLPLAREMKQAGLPIDLNKLV